MEYSIPVKLSEAILDYSDQELAELISHYEWKLVRHKYEVNEAALCLLDTAKSEWQRRHGAKPVPTVIADKMFIFEGDIDAQIY